MIEYRVEYVPDELMDSGRDFVLCNKPTDGVTLYLRRGVRDLPDHENAAVWEDAWTAFRAFAQVGNIPMQRVYAAS